MTFIAGKVRRPNPAEEHCVDALMTAKDNFENLVEHARTHGAEALRGVGLLADGAEAAHAAALKSSRSVDSQSHP